MPDPVDVTEWPPSSWGLTPTDWQAPPAPPLDALQPGLGIPVSTVDAAVAGGAPSDPTGLIPATAAQDAQNLHDTFAPGVLPSPPPWAPKWGASSPPDAMPDAISGAGGMPLGATDPMPLELPPNSVVDAYDQPKAPLLGAIGADETLDPFATPDVPRERGVLGDVYDYLDPSHPTGGPLAQQERDDLAHLAPEDLAARKVESDAQRARKLANDAEAASLKNLEQQRANYAAREEADRRTAVKMAALEKEATALSQREIDPNRLLGSSTWNRVMAAISAVLGGLAAPSMGGRNIGLEFIQKAIDQDIAAQQANLNNAKDGISARRGLLKEQIGKNGDALLSSEQLRAAAWNHAIRELETAQQNYDPRGTTAMQVEITKRGARAAQEEAIHKFAVEAHKEQLAAIRVDQDSERILEAQRHAKVDERIAQQNANTSSYSAQTSRKQGDRRLAIDEAKLPIDIQRANAEIDKLRAEGKTAQAEQLQKFGVPGVSDPNDPNGTFVATSSTPEEMTKLRGRVASTKEIVGLMDELRRTRSGWSTATGNSAEHQKLKAIQGQLKIAQKNAAELGALSASDLELVNDLIGFDDPSKYRSIEAGVMQARANVIRSTSEALKARGWKSSDPTNPDWNIADMQANKDVEQPGDAETKATLSRSASAADDYKDLGLIDDEGRVITASGEHLGRSPTTQETVDAVARAGGILPSKRRTVDAWIAGAAKGDADALAKLNLAAKDSQDDAVKQYATRALQQIAQSAFPKASVDEVQ